MNANASRLKAAIFRSALRAAPAALIASIAVVGWAQVPGEKVVGGMVFRLGIVQSEQVSSGHPADHAEREMHQPRAGRDRDHLVLSLAEEGTDKRIVDARVTASISRMGMDHSRRELQRMEAGGVVTYGEYFDLRGPGPYLIRLEVRRPGAPTPTVAEFDYRNR